MTVPLDGGDNSLLLVDNEGAGDFFLISSLVSELTKWLLADCTVLGLLFGSVNTHSKKIKIFGVVISRIRICLLHGYM